MGMKVDFPIDFVVMWVDGSDVAWNEQKAKFSGQEKDDRKETRFRDAGHFLYWFRAVEKFAPWVHKIYLVTNGQVPSFLDLNAEKVILINHEEIMPTDSLPTFNSSAIELNVANIPGLVEHFVLFNDDMFLNRNVFPEDFFSPNGLPKDTAGLNQIMPIENFDHIIANNIAIINNTFNKSKVLRKHWKLFFNLKNGPLNIYTALLYFFPRFSRLYDLHIPYSIKKSEMQKFIKQNSNQVNTTIYNRFRSITDITIWGVRYYQIVSGHISPRKYNFGKFYTNGQADKIIRDLIRGKHHVIDINDSNIENYTETMDLIGKAFEQKLPEKSQFEK